MGYREFSKRLTAWNAEGYNRRMRRVLLGVSLCVCLISFATAVLGLCIGRGGGRFYGFASFLSMVQSVGMAVFWMWLLRRNASAMSWDQRAQMEFGRGYSELSRMHQFDVRVRVAREMRQGGRPEDERDIAMQREAERRAYRVLKIGLPVAVLVYWVVCLWLPVGPVRAGLLISAVVVSGMAIPVMILPDLIRLWTEPDEVREMAGVAMEGKV
jgi:hypothetical protein